MKLDLAKFLRIIDGREEYKCTNHDSVTIVRLVQEDVDFYFVDGQFIQAINQRAESGDQ